MSYQVLARKWRPRNFEEMVGQEHILRALINGLDNDRLHHAYLFSGTRGVGKTTLGRILAKCLNCEQGVSSSPCGECPACREIAEGRFIDLIEVDAASRTKVEDTRELLENVQYAPTRGRFKVYLIDEVHMLSGHSFNALLKTLEEPPPHVKFLLATTEPQKLPVTILSRCLQFNLKNLSPERISAHLGHVLSDEKVPFEEEALWELAQAADGSMRDALSLTDQAISHGGGKISTVDVRDMLGSIDRSSVLEICRAVADNDGIRLMQVVETMAELAPNYSAALAEVLSVWHRVAIAQTVPEALDNHHSDHKTIVELAGHLSREAVQLFYQIVLMGRKDLALTPDPRSGFEMALLRLLAFQPEDEQSGTPPAAALGVVPVKKPDAPVAARPATAGQRQAPGSSVADSGRPTGVSSPAGDQPITLDDLKALASVEGGNRDSMEPASVEEVSPDVVAESAFETKGSGRISLDGATPDCWIEIYNDLPVGGILQNTAANLVLIERRENLLRFVLNVDQSALYQTAQQQQLAKVLSGYFGVPVRVAIEVGRTDRETPYAHMLRLREERQAAAVATLKNDPLVRKLVDNFNGELLERTVAPIDED